MARLDRPAGVEKWFSRSRADVRSGDRAVTRSDGRQTVFTVATARWEGSLRVGPFNRSAEAETCWSWLRRWVDDPSLWTYLPLQGMTAGDTPANLLVAAVSSSGVVTSAAPHGLAKGAGVALASKFHVVVTVPSSTTFLVWPGDVGEYLATGDGIVGTREVRAKVVQPASLPLDLERGLHRAAEVAWIEH